MGKEAPMRGIHYIGMDAHCEFCELKACKPSGEMIFSWRGPTAIPGLREAIDHVPRPRFLVVEEGPISDWLFRNLAPVVDRFVISDPRRNLLIAKEGDKDDPIDAEKLCQLLRGGYIKPIHHPDTLERAIFKQHISLYCDRVDHKDGEANRIMGFLRYHGVFVQEQGFVEPGRRAELLSRLPSSPLLRQDLLLLWKSYDSARQQVIKMRRRVIRFARPQKQIRRFTALPGVKWIRAAIFFAYLDTPWRFKSKSALWKYMGIGLERRKSGTQRAKLHVALQANRILKNVILGAAQTAIRAENNPFADSYRRLIQTGVSPKNARRTVARSLATTMWGMWKTGSVYRPEWVGEAWTSNPVARSTEEDRESCSRRSSL
jgi:transposase